MQEQVLTMLAEAGEEGRRYLSGGYIAKELGITRAAVWKYIEAIRADGGIVRAAPRLGYHLVNLDDLLQAGAVSVATSVVGQSYTYLPRVDSTNSEAKRRVRAGCPEGLVVVADNQKAGRGRMGRGWLSVPGKGLYFSVVLFPKHLPMNKVALLTPLTAVAVCRAIIDMTGLPVALKWPNDLFLKGQKVGGILLEAGGEADSVRYAIIGIGINVNLTQDDIPSDLAQIATSLYLSGGSKVARRKLLQKVLSSLDTYYVQSVNEGPESFLSEYRRLCLTLGRPIKFVWQNHTWSGVAQGINDDGGLIVKLDNQETLVLRSGDVHCL